MKLFTGGKTGGHIMPLVQIIKEGNFDSSMIVLISLIKLSFTKSLDI